MSKKKRLSQYDVDQLSRISEDEQMYNIGKTMRRNANKGGFTGWTIVILIAILLFLYFFGSQII